MQPLPLVDDKSILDEEDLWRRIHPKWAVRDENRGGLRISSAAFDDSADGSPLSVLRETVVRNGGRTPNDVMSPFVAEGYRLASLRAGDARANGQGVMSTPTPEEPAHASVFGRKPPGVKKALARAAVWVDLG